LCKLPTHPEFKTFYEQSHQVAKLRILTGVDKAKEDGTFTFDDVKNLVREALDYVSDDDKIQNEASRILNLGLQIQFVRDVGSNRYKIRSRSKSAELREDEMKRRWIKWRLDQELQERIEPNLVTLQAFYEKQRAARPTLEEMSGSPTGTTAD
jgi:hypothetical protein